MISKLYNIIRSCRSLMLTGFCLVAVGCSPTVDIHGHLLSEEHITEVLPGIHTRDDVEDLLGSPSNVGTFSDNTWYYVSKTVENFAFFDTKVLEQRVIMVKFEDTGQVKSIVQYDLGDSQAIDPIPEKTETLGHELGILEQLLGNVGRFSRDNAPSPF